jgi:hypothetical protein
LAISDHYTIGIKPKKKNFLREKNLILIKLNRGFMKEKLINNFTSRPFLVLIIAVVAFFVTNKFSEDALTWTFLIYCGYNLGGKYIAKNNNNDNNDS